MKLSTIMYLLLLIFASLISNQYLLCQRLADNQLFNFNQFKSKFIIDQPFIASSDEDNPVWNYDLDNAKDAIEASDEATEDNLKDEEQQQYEQFRQFEPQSNIPNNPFNLNNLNSLNSLNNQIQNPYLARYPYLSQYRNLDEDGFVFPVEKKKNLRETKNYEMPRNSFVNFIKDDDFDYDNDEILDEKRNQLNAKAKSNEKDNSSNEKSNEKSVNKTSKLNFENLNFDDLDEKAIRSDQIKNDVKQKNQQENDDDQKNDKKEPIALKKENIVPILKHKPKLSSKVVYSDNDEILITEDKNSTTISLPKTVGFVDEPSKEPRIRKLRRLRRLRKQQRVKQDSFSNKFANDQRKHLDDFNDEDLKDEIKDAINARNKIEEKLTTNQQLMNDKMKRLNKEFNKDASKNLNSKEEDKKWRPSVIENANNQTDSSKSRVIRIVKVIKKNPTTNQIESNVTLIDSQIKNDSKDLLLKDELNAFSNLSNLKDHSKSVSKKSIASSPFQQTKNETTTKLNNKFQNVDDYIDEFEDVETKKSKIKHVLY